eukprot:COSAG02_NODE_10987_length_1817_cov_1.415017_1_plen_351_part_00
MRSPDGRIGHRAGLCARPRATRIAPATSPAVRGDPAEDRYRCAMLLRSAKTARRLSLRWSPPYEHCQYNAAEPGRLLLTSVAAVNFSLTRRAGQLLWAQFYTANAGIPARASVFRNPLTFDSNPQKQLTKKPFSSIWPFQQQPALPVRQWMAHSFSSMAGRLPEVEAELRGELLTLLDGTQLDEAWVSEALGGRFVLDRGSLEQQHAVHGNMGVLDTGQSLSADLRVIEEGAADRPQQRGLYIKKIQAKRFAHKKTLQNLRRDLASCHNECSFYAEIVPLLIQDEQQATVVRIPHCYYVSENSFHGADSEEQLSQSEYMLVLESMTTHQHASSAAVALCQHSPLRCATNR